MGGRKEGNGYKVTTPYPFQEEDVNRAIKEMKGRAIFAWPMGTGKSYAALRFAQLNPEDRPIIVVCPAGLKWNWKIEAAKHINMRGEILETFRPPVESFKRPHQLLIINYEILRAGKRGKPAETWPWVSYLRSLNPKLIILDEIHTCSNRKSLQTLAVRALCRGVKHRIALTGTPLVNRPADLWPTLNIIRPGLFPSFLLFGEEFCSPKKVFGKWEYKGAENLSKLRKQLQPVMLRRRKEDVLKDLPPKRRIVVPIDIRHRKRYQEAANRLRDWLESNRNNPDKKERRSLFVHLKQMAAEFKLEAAMEWLDNFLEESDEKIIVFAWHTKIIRKLKERYAGLNVVVDGKIRGRDRKLAIEKFLQDKKCRVLFGNIKAAGMGWSAKGVCNTAFFELWFNPSVHAQAEDRTHGIGRGKKNVRSTSYYLVARNTIESSLVKLIQERQKVINAILDGDKATDSFSIYDKLTKLLLKETKEMSKLNGKSGVSSTAQS